MRVLGLSFGYHDSAAALLVDGDVVAASSEERFSRVKNSELFPQNAIRFCLETHGCALNSIDKIVYYEDSFLKFERVLNTALADNELSILREVIDFNSAEGTFDMRRFIALRLGVEIDKVHMISHHESHASSAFFCSPFEHAGVLTVDGVGEFDTSAIWLGSNNSIIKLESIELPHSIGLVYSAFTSFLGFEVNEGEYKVMGMAPFGAPKYLDKVLSTLEIGEYGFKVKNEFYNFLTPKESMYRDKFLELFGEPRDKEEPFFIEGFEMWSPKYLTRAKYDAQMKRNHYYADVAASLQKACEIVLLMLSKRALALSNSKNLCIAGGVALNSVANGKLKRELGLNGLFIQPASGDAGGALGAALYYYRTTVKKPKKYVQTTAHLGKMYSRDEIWKAIKENAPLEEILEFESEDSLIEFCTEQLCNKKVLGLMNFRSEWGPRALGARSIIADPRTENMKQVVNEKIKFRELFRPFAPSVLSEYAHEWFEIGTTKSKSEPENFMLSVVPVKREKQVQIPAVTHVDGSARIHLVRRDINPFYYALIESFYDRSGIPIVLNTSFNLRGEPIVETPKSAILTFSYCDMDYLVMPPFVLKSAWNKEG